MIDIENLKKLIRDLKFEEAKIYLLEKKTTNRDDFIQTLYYIDYKPLPDDIKAELLKLFITNNLTLFVDLILEDAYDFKILVDTLIKRIES